jgi:hypothetical protein
VCLALSVSLAACSGSSGWFSGGGIPIGGGVPNLPGPGPGVFPDTWTGIHAFQVFDSRISHQKAVQDASRYDLVWGTTQPGAWKSGNARILTSYYAPFEGDFTTAHGLTWWQQNHPDWVLYKCNKTTPAWPGGLKNVPLDISNPAVYRWQMQTYAGVMESGGFNGLAADLVAMGNFDGGCGVFVNGVWTQRFTGQQIDDTWTQAVLAWMRYTYDYLHEEPRPLVLGINHVPENRAYGDPEEIDLLNHTDFVDDESSFTDFGNGYASKPKVELIIQWMKYIQSIGKPYIVDDKWNTQTINQQQLGWGISTYMLGKYHYASLYVDHLPGYGYEYWYPQYTAKVGSPCGDMVADPLHLGIFTRKYSGSYVIVNTTLAQTFVVTLPHLSYTSIFGQQVTSPMTIGPDTGAVLLTTQGCR